jgi:hypothetical protein
LPAFSSRRAAAIQPGPWCGLVVITLFNSNRACGVSQHTHASVPAGSRPLHYPVSHAHIYSTQRITAPPLPRARMTDTSTLRASPPRSPFLCR